MYNRTRVCMCILIMIFCFVYWLLILFHVLSAVDLWYFHQFLWFIYLHCTISTCIYFCLQSYMFWMSVISYWCYILFYFLCFFTNNQDILNEKISIHNNILYYLFLLLEGSFHAKKKLVLLYRIFYKFTVIFVTCWNLQIIKTTFIFFTMRDFTYMYVHVV